MKACPYAYLADELLSLPTSSRHIIINLTAEVKYKNMQEDKGCNPEGVLLKGSCVWVTLLFFPLYFNVLTF
jgi:hypothetical protein